MIDEADSELSEVAWHMLDASRGVHDDASALQVALTVIALKSLSDWAERESGDSAVHLPGANAELLVPAAARFSVLERASDVIRTTQAALDGLAVKNPRCAAGFESLHLPAGWRTPSSGELLRELVSMAGQVRIARVWPPDRSSAGSVCTRLLQRSAERGKRTGDVTPPWELAELLVDLVAVAGPGVPASVCDPNCGTGELLVACGRRWGQDGKAIAVYGLERRASAVASSNVHLLLSGHLPLVEAGDPLSVPTLSDTREPKTHGAVVTIVPIGAKTPTAVRKGSLGRFPFGIPSNAELLYVQDALRRLSDDGVAVVLVGRGALFRGGKEAEVRARLVTEGLIEAVIDLPANILLGSAIPTSVLVLRPARSRPVRRPLLFVDAASCAESTRGRRSLSSDLRRRVEGAVRSRAEEPGFARLVDESEIQRAGFDLSVARYVRQPVETTAVDLSAAAAELAEVEQLRADAEKRMDQAVAALGQLLGAS